MSLPLEMWLDEKQKQATSTIDVEDEMCECGDTESQHVDGCEQCVVAECGCREFNSIERGLSEDDLIQEI